MKDFLGGVVLCGEVLRYCQLSICWEARDTAKILVRTSTVVGQLVMSAVGWLMAFGIAAGLGLSGALPKA